MFHGCVFVIVCSAFLATVLARSITQDLEFHIENLKNETSATAIENEKLYKDLEALPHLYQKKVSELNIDTHNVSQEVKDEMAKIKSLKTVLNKLQVDEKEMNELEGQYHETLSYIGKLDLGLKLLFQEVDHLEKRRNESDDKRCLRLQHTLKTNTIDLESNNTDFKDKVIDQANQLKEVVIKFADAKKKNRDLKTKLTEANMFWTMKLHKLNNMIHGINGNLATAKSNSEQLKTNIQGTKEDISTLKKGTEHMKHTLEKGMKSIEVDTKTLRKLRKTIYEHSEAIACYSKLREELLQH